MRTMGPILQATILTIAALLIVVPPSSQAFKPHGKKKLIVVTNNHTNFLSLRCFSFDDNFDVTHLAPWAQYQFFVRPRKVYSSATMFNCSTNMGTFVAYKFNYECSDQKIDRCDWRFDEDSAYRWEPKSGRWSPQDFQPNYESLDRGGVIKGYFAN